MERFRDCTRPDWQRTEHNVAAALKARGVKCRVIGRHKSPFDIVTARGQRVEVKLANRTTNGRWNFSISRAGKLREQEIEWYVLALRGLAPRTRVYVILRAPLCRKMVSMSLRSLVLHYASNIADWDSIIKVENA